MNAATVLWIYIVLLLVGGVMGFVKAKSTVSLVTALVFAGLLSLGALGVIKWPHFGDVLLLVLVGVFAWRFGKTRKFWPAGGLVVITIAALLVRAMMLL